MYGSIAFQCVEQHPAAASALVGCAAARHGNQHREQKIEVLFVRMDAVEALHGDLACDAVFFGVFFVYVSARGLGKRDLFAVPKDGIGGIHAFAAAEAGVDLDTDASKKFPDVLAVKGERVVPKSILCMWRFLSMKWIKPVTNAEIR